jgi:hypothetical protein
MTLTEALERTARRSAAQQTEKTCTERAVPLLAVLNEIATLSAPMISNAHFGYALNASPDSLDKGEIIITSGLYDNDTDLPLDLQDKPVNPDNFGGPYRAINFFVGVNGIFKSRPLDQDFSEADKNPYAFETIYRPCNNIQELMPRLAAWLDRNLPGYAEAADPQPQVPYRCGP